MMNNNMEDRINRFEILLFQFIATSYLFHTFLVYCILVSFSFDMKLFVDVLTVVLYFLNKSEPTPFTNLAKNN